MAKPTMLLSRRTLMRSAAAFLAAGLLAGPAWAAEQEIGRAHV